jgi:uncharacterized repeat protein (TIGR03803 family)
MRKGHSDRSNADCVCLEAQRQQRLFGEAMAVKSIEATKEGSVSKMSVWKTFCLCLVLCAAAVGASAQTFTTLVNFDGSNGESPLGDLVQGPDGNFYGTTQNGGLSIGQGSGGTVFSVTPGGTLTTLYSFCSQPNCTDGNEPAAGLTLASDGNFYGTTFDGGTGAPGGGSCGGVNIGPGCGTIFKITPTGTLTTLYNFCTTDCSDGAGPNGGLIQGLDGSLYGTAEHGGHMGFPHCPTGCGVVFKITLDGTYTVLATFRGHGANPEGSLLETLNGDLYGTTLSGSLDNSSSTAFRLTTSGKIEILHDFCQQVDCTDGSFATSGFAQIGKGNLYGATAGGGLINMPNCGLLGIGCGVVYSLTPGIPSSITSRYEFCQLTSCDDGALPFGGLAVGSDRNFYGLTEAGGTGTCPGIDNPIVGDYPGCGTIYSVTPLGTLTTLHNFAGTDGAWPFGGLTQGTDGVFYGTTTFGGSTFGTTTCNGALDGGCGTVFSIATGLKPFVKTVPAIGTIGTSVMILGYKLTGAKCVMFGGGISAAFTVVSDTEIVATVPTGATTGKVKVTTLHGTLTSNTNFVVQ